MLNTRKAPVSRQQREDEKNARLRALVESARLAPPQRGVMRRVDAPALPKWEAKPITPKTPSRKQQSIRDSARNELCQVRIPGCPSDPAMTIWSHLPSASGGKGGALKALDLCGAYSCTHCDAVIDGQRPLPAGYSRAMAMNDWFHGHMRSLVILRQKGLV